MLTTPVEVARRAAGRVTGRIRTLPILALSVHSACNCRCVMCDIWKANAHKREISVAALDAHVAAIRRMHVQRVMLTGGEPLLHSSFWELCERLRREHIRLTLVTTGLLVEAHAGRIAALMDAVVISVDGAPTAHDTIRGVRGGFDRIARGVRALRDLSPQMDADGFLPQMNADETQIGHGRGHRRQRRGPSITVRSVLQKGNYGTLEETIAAVYRLGVDRLSFLAADVSSTAFNRPTPWSAERRAEVQLSRDELLEFAATIKRVDENCRDIFVSEFVEGGLAALWRIYDYYAALAGLGDWPVVSCNAPWVSAVVETDGRVRPCFFQPAYESTDGAALDEVINSPQAIAFRRHLDVRRDETCRRCVCTLSLPLGGRA